MDFSAIGGLLSERMNQDKNLKIDSVSHFRVNQFEVCLSLCAGNRPVLFLMGFPLHFNCVCGCSRRALLEHENWTCVWNTQDAEPHSALSVHFMMHALLLEAAAHFSLLFWWNLKDFVCFAFRLFHVCVVV